MGGAREAPLWDATTGKPPPVRWEPVWVVCRVRGFSLRRDSDVREQGRVIVVLDTSASMQTIDDTGHTRLETAKSQVEHMVKSLKTQDEMAILVAGNQPKVICGLTGHQRTLQNRLEAVTPTDGPTKVSEAVEIGRRLLTDSEKGEVVVVTDGCFDDATAIAAEEKIVWSQIGAATSNVGLTRFQVRRSLLDLIGFQVLVEVSNFSQTPVTCSLDLNFNDGTCSGNFARACRSTTTASPSALVRIKTLPRRM